MSFGDFLKKPFQMHRSVARRITPKGSLGNQLTNSSTMWGHDGMIPLDKAPPNTTGTYQRNPLLQQKLDEFGAAEKLAAARALYAQTYGGPPRTAPAAPPTAAPAAQPSAKRPMPPAMAGALSVLSHRGYADGGKVIKRKRNGKPYK